MKLHCPSLWLFAVAGLSSLTINLKADEPDSGPLMVAVGRLLEQGHYSRRKLDDSVSKLLLTNYLEALDYNHLFFTQADVDGFTKKYGTTLDEDTLLGNPEPAYAIFNLYKKRVEDRVANARELLTQKYDFKSDRTVALNRQKAAWPKDAAEADQIWRDRVENELLVEALSKTEKNPIERINKRYDSLLRSLREQTKEDMVNIFLNTLAQTYDPHSDYLSKSESENFAITMRLSMFGIGAVLQSDEGYTKIMDLSPGGPADKDGRLKVGDRISGVAQGDSEFVEVVDMKLNKVVELIRGKKDSVVRLQVLPANASDPGVRKIVEIKRDEVKLKDQEAKAEIVERPMPDGSVQRLGWIVLPSFYADMKRSGSPTAKSTTRDVLALINRLKQENISGLVMDLRRDGGGSLEEAVNLTGLFIKRGPVVQIKDANGSITACRDKDSSIAYDGPMIVLTDRLSASASEIFAAALQDYGRAVVVGDSSTFGKGTVQSMLDIAQVMPFLGAGNAGGSLKLTIQKFYRIAGGATQLKGVNADIALPSTTDHPEFGESAMKGPLPYDTVDAAPYERWSGQLFKSELSQRSAARIASDQEFKYIAEDNALLQKRLDENRISLNLEKRKGEIDDEKSRKDHRKVAREKATPPTEKRFAITLENVAKPGLELYSDKKEGRSALSKALDADPENNAETEAPAKVIDAVRNETLNILGDLVGLTHGVKTAQTK